MDDSRSELAHRLDSLHELLYARGGVKPVNAAIDELCKLLLLNIHARRHPYDEVGGTSFSQMLDPDFIRSNPRSVEQLRAAFQEANRHRDYQWRQSADGFFVEGDTLRLTDPVVLAEAAQILASLSVQVPSSGHSPDAIDLERVRIEDTTGLAFEVFLRGRYQHGGGLGTYLTPEPVVEAMTSMALAHVSKERLLASDLLVGDPCCGTGRFLLSAMRHIEDRLIASAENPKAAAHQIEHLRQNGLFGADQSDSSLLKARLNFLMYNSAPRLERVEDSITATSLHALHGQFDLILTNPPFGGGKYDRPEGLQVMRRADLGTVAGWSWPESKFAERRAIERADPAILFLDYDLSLLRPGGILGIVLPDGVLGPKYKSLYDALLRDLEGVPAKAELLALVSLPRQTFALSGTAAKTSFLILRKRPSSESPGKVYVGRAAHVGYEQRGSQLIPDPMGNDLEGLAREYTTLLADGSARPSIGQLIPAHLLVSSLDPHGSWNSEPSLNSRSVAEFAALRRGRPRTRGDGDDFFLSILHVGSDFLVDWIAASEYSPKTPGKECGAGDVLLSCLNPQIPRITVIPSEAGTGLCSAEFAVLQPTQFDAYRLALILRSDPMTAYLSAAGRGTSSSRRRIDSRMLLAAPVPDSLANALGDASAELKTVLASDRDARIRVAGLLEEVRSQQPPER